jgi:CBS domain-containing protein
VTEITERAVAARVPSLVDEKLKSLRRREPLTVRPGTALEDCLALVQRVGVGDSVFVTEKSGKLKGVLTERDIFAKLVRADVDLSQPVESLMVDHPWTLHLDEPIRHAIDLMQTGRYRNVPLVDDDGNLVGVVRPVDVLKFLAEAFPEELLNLPPRAHQRMRAQEGG